MKDEQIEKNRSRIETRKVSVIEDLSWLSDAQCWPGLRQLVKVERQWERLINGKKESETVFYLSSTKGNAKELQSWIRGHWGIENGLHWRLDMIWKEDMDCKRSENAAPNFLLMRKAALNLIMAKKHLSPKMINNRLRKRAARNQDFGSQIFQDS